MKVITSIQPTTENLEDLDGGAAVLYWEEDNAAHDILEMKWATHEIVRANRRLERARETLLDLAGAHYRLATIRNRLHQIAGRLKHSPEA